MKLLKQILRTAGGLAAGIGIGIAIATAGIMLFTDTTFSEYMEGFRNLEIGDGLAAAAVGIASFLISITILVILHEGGHLLFGLLSGYRFVSFRIFNVTFIKINDRLRIKRFAIAGTGGQCLLSPPDRPIEDIPAFWYNAGGLIANILVLAVAIPLLCVIRNPFICEFLSILIFTDIIMLIINGIPMQMNGIGNDARNILLLRRDMNAKRGMVIQLRSNALIQEGVRPKDMPDEWFEIPKHINYKSALEAAIPIMHASRTLDMGCIEEAYQEFEDLYSHKEEIMPLYVKEIACELAFTSLATGRTDRARELLDEELMKYIETYRKTMSSKERLLFAIAIRIENNPEKADKIYQSLAARQSDYLLQGEAASDLALMSSFRQFTTD